MSLASKTALTALGVVALGVGVVAVRTATYKPPAQVDFSQVKLASAPAIDQAKAAQHLAEAVRIQTISHQLVTDNDYSQWDRLHAWLQATYPAAHTAMAREILPNKALIYTWQGSDASLAPIILMAHQDVVPVTPGTEKDWKHAPFSGDIADGAVWGRGSVDDKGSLVTMFEALDALAASGFKPRRTVIIVSGQDEEAGGTGAAAAAALLKARGVKAAWALDEGQATVKDYPLTGKPVALIGIAEKGYATLVVTAPAKGGHSSAPPKVTGVTTLAQAVLKIAGNPFPLKFKGPGADSIRALAPQASLMTRIVVANTWLFGGALKAQIAQSPAGASSLHTTIAPTMLKGSPKENVLPQDASAWINYRIAPGDSSADIMARARGATKGLNVTFRWDKPPREPSPVSSTSSDGWKIIAALASDGGTTPVAPGLVTAGTDSRSMSIVTPDVYRYQPLLASLTDFEMIHGTNEKMTLENLGRMTKFYAVLIATSAG
ncbi:carboxypeptidase PM20D1 [Caulobacter ginsengisoli]|uniref:Carboxypeptidase PM20D1 n=1 Tax=Caulobacter ginsengisoli TaxID=400775 RepID=A0ABU0IRU6_9CAUL|nr:M20 family peptidase [Caulobacter ginsengisoli]MDQ0464742.1 carboxypeptidase PM20D1 [Caulobacter ginsengisoli]